MVETRRTGRTEHETVEVPPAVLDCGHPYTPGQVTVGYGTRPEDPDGQRGRTYRCRCGQTTYAER